MNDQNEKKYKQLALFSVIVAEVVVSPSALGGLVYLLTKENKFQMPLTISAALLGLIVAFIRIFKMGKLQSKGQDNE